MGQVYDKLVKCYECIREKVDFQPKVAMILGSGLGDFAETIKIEATLAASKIINNKRRKLQ